MTPKKCMFIAKSLTDTLHVELEPLCQDYCVTTTVSSPMLYHQCVCHHHCVTTTEWPLCDDHWKQDDNKKPIFDLVFNLKGFLMALEFMKKLQKIFRDDSKIINFSYPWQLGRIIRKCTYILLLFLLLILG